MMYGKKLRNVAASLLLITSAMLLSGCGLESLRVKLATDCVWYEPLAMSEETMDWLEGNKPWPQPFFEELKRMGDNEDNYDDFCQ